MATKALALVFAGVSALAAAPSASADELATDNATLALPDQPAGDDALDKESASSPATVVDTNGVLQPSGTLPTTMTVTMPQGGGTSIVNTSTSAIATSTLNATITGNGF
ncbi:MAG: hypothetical protein ACREEV_02965 [Dongiaceae bacterium]